MSKIRLNKLRVIRGMTLHQVARGDTPRFSLYVAQNSREGHDTVGLQELQMPSLVGKLHIFLFCMSTLNFSIHSPRRSKTF